MTLALVSQDEAPARTPLTPAQRILVEHTRPLVPGMLRDLVRAYRLTVSWDELTALADEGLVEAALSYDPSLGTPFSTFARFRIHGAVLDGIRKEARVFGLQAAIRRAGNAWLSLEHGTVDVLHATEKDSREQLERLVHRLAMGVTAQLALRAEKAIGEDEMTAYEETAKAREALNAAVSELHEEDRALVDAVYYQGLLLKDAATALGISYPTCKRHHCHVLERLAARLRARGITNAPPVMDWPEPADRTDNEQRCH